MGARSILFQTRLLPLVVRHRWLIYELVLRDLRLRYRGSLFGFAWTLLNPVLFTAVYVLIFGEFLKVGIDNYALYLLCGLLPWNWLANAVQAGTSSIVDGRNYVGKTVFPTELLVVVPLLSNAVNFVWSLPLLGLVVAFYHVPIAWEALLYLPVLLAVQALTTLAALFVFATLNVFYRDFQQLVSYVLLLLFYLVPIVYPIDRVPPALRGALSADPIAIVIAGYQDIFYRGRPPDLDALLYACGVGLVSLAAAYAFLERNKEALAEYL